MNQVRRSERYSADGLVHDRRDMVRRLATAPAALAVGWALVSQSAAAGDHRAVCDKVAASTHVVEMTFTQTATWSNEYRERGWPPPRAELLKTAMTGRVTEVFKGALAQGVQWDASLGVLFGVSGMANWKVFIEQKEFQQVWFIGPDGKTTGWAEEAAGCGSSDRSSWCSGYAEHLQAVRTCLSPTD